MIVFRLSVGVGFAGYIMLVLEFTGLGLLFAALLGPGASLTGEPAAASFLSAAFLVASSPRVGTLGGVQGCDHRSEHPAVG
jgi:hypothetical protein